MPAGGEIVRPAQSWREFFGNRERKGARHVNAEQEREYAEEAKRLALLPIAEQRKAVAIILSPADNPKLSRADRRAAAERADALIRHLRRLNRGRRKT